MPPSRSKLDPPHVHKYLRFPAAEQQGLGSLKLLDRVTLKADLCRLWSKPSVVAGTAVARCGQTSRTSKVTG